MYKTVEKAIDHCIQHKFLSVDPSRFSFLGLLLQHRIQDIWFQNNVTVSNEALMVENVKANQPLSVELLQILQESKALIEPNAGISFASVSTSGKENRPETRPKTIDDLMKAMHTTCLNLHTFIHPSQKIDHFTSFQKKRRYWWKSFLHQPELIKIHNVPNPGPLVEQRIEVGSSLLGDSLNNPLEVISIWKPDIFDTLEVKSCTSDFECFPNLTPKLIGWQKTEGRHYVQRCERSKENNMAVSDNISNYPWTCYFILSDWCLYRQ